MSMFDEIVDRRWDRGWQVSSSSVWQERRAGFQSRRLRPALPSPAHWDKIRTQCEPHTPSPSPPPLLKQSS